MDLDELFRRKLEDAELIPGSDVNSRLMKKLARREFLRFNPARFNIYYLGLIVAGVLTAGILLFGGRHSENNKTEKADPERHGSVIIPEISPSRKSSRTGISPKNSVTVGKDKDITRSQNNDSLLPADERRKDITITPAGVEDKLVKSNLFGDAIVSKLKEPSKSNIVAFTPSVISGCSPLRVHFGNVTGDFTGYLWNFADEGTSDRKEPDWTFSREGYYTVTLIARTPEGYSSSYSTTIRVFPKPVARFEMSPEKAIIPDDEIRFLNNSSNAVSSRWNFGDGNTSEIFEPKHRYEKFGHYAVSLTVTSEDGCTDTTIMRDAFSGSEYFVEMPNAFIPNPDGPSGGLYSIKSDEISEIFHPVFSGISDYHLKIYSKMGILVFESNDVTIGWDGYFKGQLSNPGVYIWKITGYFRNGQIFSKIGDVTLLKN